jgi:hypothetical protein
MAAKTRRSWPEPKARARQYDAANRRVRRGGFHCIAQFRDHLIVEGVENFWPVHGDGEDAVFLLREQVLVIGL